ncbi:hypothetical protein NEMIN01_0438 [Nematocida minor]|uniref:uncharacterized protein n=1 Tax=Nematocida minor TaxID=1912983 RepID=UPI00221EBFD8|nr:uncharacterized protein NEMIN01_0438 [Nematocida minor]KAI5189375.1 hypothetical protein NEMIN01_0438 [Nematocida minor]
MVDGLEEIEETQQNINEPGPSWQGTSQQSTDGYAETEAVNERGHAPPPYDEAVLLPEPAGYIPPPNYHDAVQQYISERPVIPRDFMENYNNISRDPHYVNAPPVSEQLYTSTLKIWNKVYYDMHALFVLFVYYIPVYLVGPFLYSAMLDQILLVSNGGSKAFPKGVDFDPSYDFLSYGIMCILFLIFKTVLWFFLGKLSYLGVLSSKLEIESDFTGPMHILIFIMNIATIQIFYALYDYNISNIAFYTPPKSTIIYAVLLLTYIMVCIKYLKDIYSYITGWSNNALHESGIFDESTEEFSRVIAVIGITVCLVGLSGAICLLYDSFLNVIDMFNIEITIKY